MVRRPPTDPGCLGWQSTASISERWHHETSPGLAGESSIWRSIESTPYVPLPIRMSDPESGPVVSEPSAAMISELFSKKRSPIVVIGPGGAGKTTFARQVGYWALLGGQPGGLQQHAMIPVWVDEDMDPKEKRLNDVIKGKLTSMLPDAKLDDTFIEALLKKQRLLVILDRVSERSKATQQYIGTIYRSTPVVALLVTSRTYLSIGGSTPITVYPQLLDHESLLYFMTSLLKTPLSTNGGSRRAPLSLDKQLELGSRLALLYQSSLRANAPVLPLPVRLFVEEARALLNGGLPLERLPLSIPAVYSWYPGACKP